MAQDKGQTMGQPIKDTVFYHLLDYVEHTHYCDARPYETLFYQPGGNMCFWHIWPRTWEQPGLPPPIEYIFLHYLVV